MKSNIKIILSLTLIILSNVVKAAAPVAIEDNIKRLNWNGIDVIYIEDNRFPTYDLTIYFADGALSDSANSMGLTQHSFNLLDSGTDKLSQKEILDQLEFYGTEFAADVTHEYSTVSISGLSKDLKTTVNQFCSLFREATYPEAVIKKELELERTGLQSLVASPQGLTERIFREISLGKTPYSYPVGGKIKDLKTYTAKNLREKMDYFLDKVKKRIYLTGPKSILDVEKVIVEECRFKGSNDNYVRKVTTPKKRIHKTEFVFVPVPDANQVQLRIGRFLNHDEVFERNLDALASDFLGGGFTSKLMREVRVKRGLTYSIGSYISAQKQYGRSGISTFTKNQTIDSLINVIDTTITNIIKEGVTKEDLDQAMQGLVGAYPFKFENNRAFLGQLLLLDHIEKPYSDLFDFKEAVQKYNEKDVARKVNEIFNMKSQVIFVLGDRSIEPKLRSLTKKYGPLQVVNFKPYL